MEFFAAKKTPYGEITVEKLMMLSAKTIRV